MAVAEGAPRLGAAPAALDEPAVAELVELGAEAPLEDAQPAAPLAEDAAVTEPLAEADPDEAVVARTSARISARISARVWFPVSTLDAAQRRVAAMLALQRVRTVLLAGARLAGDPPADDPLVGAQADRTDGCDQRAAAEKPSAGRFPARMVATMPDVAATAEQHHPVAERQEPLAEHREARQQAPPAEQPARHLARRAAGWCRAGRVHGRAAAARRCWRQAARRQRAGSGREAKRATRREPVLSPADHDARPARRRPVHDFARPESKPRRPHRLCPPARVDAR